MTHHILGVFSAQKGQWWSKIFQGNSSLCVLNYPVRVGSLTCIGSQLCDTVGMLNGHYATLTLWLFSLQNMTFYDYGRLNNSIGPIALCNDKLSPDNNISCIRLGVQCITDALISLGCKLWIIYWLTYFRTCKVNSAFRAASSIVVFEVQLFWCFATGVTSVHKHIEIISMRDSWRTSHIVAMTINNPQKLQL